MTTMPSGPHRNAPGRTKQGQIRRAPAAAGKLAALSDDRLIAALKQVKPEKRGAVEKASAASESTAPAASKGVTEVEQRRVLEILAVANLSSEDPGDPKTISKLVRSATGVKSTGLALQLLNELICLPTAMGIGETLAMQQTVGIALLQEFGPKNANEGMLAVQMSGVHRAALRFLRLAIDDSQDPSVAEFSTRAATSLMRLFLQQTEAMARLKGNFGHQTVTVEHVHVYPGGQAIVGSVRGQPEGAEGRGQP